MRADGHSMQAQGLAQAQQLAACLHVCALLLSAGPQFANKLDQLLEQVDMNQTQLCATEHIEVRARTAAWEGLLGRVLPPPLPRHVQFPAAVLQHGQCDGDPVQAAGIRTACYSCKLLLQGLPEWCWLLRVCRSVKTSVCHVATASSQPGSTSSTAATKSAPTVWCPSRGGRSRAGGPTTSGEKCWRLGRQVSSTHTAP